MNELTVIDSPDTLRENRLPPGQKLRKDFPVLHHGNTPQINISQWGFKIRGLVQKETTLNLNQFKGLSQIRVHSDIHCVTGWSRLDNLWEGPSAINIYELASVLSQARFVIVHGFGDFTTNLNLDDFMQTDVLFALKHDHKEISAEHGYPVRLVVPRLYFWKSAKWVTGLEFTDKDIPGFWESNGYHNRGDPWKEERYS